MSDYQREYYKKHRAKRLAYERERYADPVVREKAKARARVWAVENQERKAATNKEWYEKNRSKILANRLKRTFDISPEQYEEMLKAQGGSCAICERGEVIQRNGQVKRLAVDHDHSTGAVRALLCQQCNTGIGNLREEPTLLEKAAAYLRKHGK